MSQFSWTFDQPTGVFKNHKLSNKIREASIVKTIFAQFVDAEPGYGKKNGESITITRISNVPVPTSSVLVEGMPMSETTFSLSTQAITVAENGSAIPFTSLSMDLAYFDEQNKIQKKLMQQMKISMDNAAATAAKSGRIVAAPDGISSITFNTAAAPTTATVNLNVYHVEQIRDYMFSTLYLEPYANDDYMCVISTKAKRGIMSDPDWKDWHKYTDPQSKFNGEVGRLEGIRFIETNNSTALSNSKGTGSVLGEAVFFGDDFLTMAVAQDPELRVKVTTDYGRSKGIAWYGIYGFGQIFSDVANAGEARSVYVTSA